MNLIKSIKIKLQALVVFGLSFALVGCESSPEEVIHTLCQNEFAQFEAQFISARISLEPWRKEKLNQDDDGFLVAEEQTESLPPQKGKTKGRSLASLQEQSPKEELIALKNYIYQPLEVSDRELWQKWARQKLDEAQHWQDLVQNRPELKAEFHSFSLMANEIVAIHGYAATGSAQGIFRSLYAIQEENENLRGRLCKK